MFRQLLPFIIPAMFVWQGFKGIRFLIWPQHHLNALNLRRAKKAKKSAEPAPGAESKAVSDKAKELGITGAKVPSSSLDKITAEFLEEQIKGERVVPDPATSPATEPTAAGKTAPPTVPADSTRKPISAGTENSSGLKRIRLSGILRLALGIFGVWLTGLSVGWNGFQTPSWSDSQSPELAAILEQQGQTIVGHAGCLGLAIVAMDGTNQTIVTLGRSSLHGKIITADTVFEIGSLSKTFTGIALAQAIEQGALPLDTKVQSLLPGDCTLPEPARDITLQHLTTHTSGFPRLPGNMSTLRLLGASFTGSNPYAGYSETQFLQAVQQVELVFEPGQKSRYSNFGVALLGYLIARNQGTTWEALVQEGIGKPLQMSDTSATLSLDQQSRFASGYRAILQLGPLTMGLTSQPWNLTNHWAGAGALRSTPRDMLRYLQANMNPQQHSIGNALEQSHQVLHRSSEWRALGMNWLWGQPEDFDQNIIWHNGGTGGFRSFLGFTEDRQVGVAILSIGSRSVDELAFAILKYLADPKPDSP